MKLSRGVLGLKFMRKTRDQLEKTETEKKHRKHFQGGDEASIKSEGESAGSSSTQSSIRVCPSYLQVERFTYARQSYGGMNPSVEENIRKGVWQMEFEIPLSDEESETKRRSIKKEQEEGEISDDGNSDDDMKLPIMGSIIGTIGKRFNRKNKFKRPHDDVQDNFNEAEVAAPKRSKRQPRWKKPNKGDGDGSNSME